MKIFVVFLTFCLFLLVFGGDMPGSPEEWAEDSYKYIQGFKGDKKSFFGNFTVRLMQQNMKMKGKLSEAQRQKGIELLVQKMTGNEVVSAKELSKFFEDMMKTMKG